MRKLKRLPPHWRKRVIVSLIEEKSESFVVFDLLFINGKTPKGFKRHIGQLSIDTDHPDYYYVVESGIFDERLKHKGMGKLMYTTALQYLGRLSTRYHDASDEAQRVWKSLARDYEHETDFWKNTLTVFNGRKRGRNRK